MYTGPCELAHEVFKFSSNDSADTHQTRDAIKRGGRRRGRCELFKIYIFLIFKRIPRPSGVGTGTRGREFESTADGGVSSECRNRP